MTLAILGAVLGLVGLGLMGVGSVVLALFGTDGQTSIPIGNLQSAEGRAVVLTDFQISSSTPLPLNEEWFDLRLDVTGEQAHFVGVAAKADSIAYLQGVPYELVTGFDSASDNIDSTTIPGDARPADPQTQAFWTDSQTGRDAAVTWPVSDSDTTLVVMNKDASAGVDAAVSVLLTIAWAGAAGIGVLVAGLLLVVLAIVLLALALRSGPKPPQPQTWPAPEQNQV